MWSGQEESGREQSAGGGGGGFEWTGGVREGAGCRGTNGHNMLNHMLTPLSLSCSLSFLHHTGTSHSRAPIKMIGVFSLRYERDGGVRGGVGGGGWVA